MTIFFDLDDTLLDHSSACVAGATALHQRTGSERSLDAFVTHWESSLQRHYSRYLAGELSYDEQHWERVREVVDESLADADAARVFSIYLEAYETSWRLFPDAAVALDQLAGHRIGIITNGQVEQQRRKLERTGLLSRCEWIVISEEFGAAKPDPTIFRHACTRSGDIPARVVYVGDRYDVDAQAARRAGLQGVWLDRHRTTHTLHEPPVITSLAELPILVSNLAGLANIQMEPTLDLASIK